MDKKKYIRLDADNIGDSIELYLLKEDVKNSQEIHFKVQNSIALILDKIKESKNTLILMRGCDDILFSVNEDEFDLNFLEKIRKEFKANSGFTLSIGIGDSILQAMQNLRVAKISGKNKIIGK